MTARVARRFGSVHGAGSHCRSRMRTLTFLATERDPRTQPDPPKAPPPPIATCQRDLVVWSLLVCPGQGKARP
jgi:hypothetical protein